MASHSHNSRGLCLFGPTNVNFKCSFLLFLSSLLLCLSNPLNKAHTDDRVATHAQLYRFITFAEWCIRLFLIETL